jgi:hypothetical protein
MAMGDESNVNRWKLDIPHITYKWNRVTRAYHREDDPEEQPMYSREYADFQIREVHSRISADCVLIEVDGLHSLPHALRRLAEMGYDLTDAHKALDEAVEAQRKRNALDEAVKAMAKSTE